MPTLTCATDDAGTAKASITMKANMQQRTETVRIVLSPYTRIQGWSLDAGFQLRDRNQNPTLSRQPMRDKRGATSAYSFLKITTGHGPISLAGHVAVPAFRRELRP